MESINVKNGSNSSPQINQNLVNVELFSWEADERTSFKFNGSQKITWTALMVLLGLYFLWVGQAILSIAIGALFFILYSVYASKPQRVKHIIETYGIRTFDTLYTWDQLKEFWFVEKDGVLLLYINTRINLPSRLLFLVEDVETAQTIISLLTEVLPYRVLHTKQGKLDIMLEGKYLEPEYFMLKILDDEQT